jgi:hypothetical protein
MADVAVQRYTVNLIEPEQTIEVDANRIDLRRWEAANGVAWFDAPGSLTKLDQLAYYACVRTGAFEGTWQDFDARAAAVTTRPDPTAAPDGPTRDAATGASSSTSPDATATSRASSKGRAKT